MSDQHPALARADAFCRRFGLSVPVLLAPMAGACPTSLSAAVANAGGLGACGALLMQPAAILSWAKELRAASNGPFQLNLWIPTRRRSAMPRTRQRCAPSSQSGAGGDAEFR